MQIVTLSLIILDRMGSSTYISAALSSIIINTEGSSQPSIDRFLKLMLGVAVTCSNKQTFIDKIQVTPALVMADDEDGWHY